MTKRTSTDMIVIHCSDTYDHMDIGVQEINRWHLDRGWSGNGYPFVIRRACTLATVSSNHLHRPTSRTV